VRPSSCRHALGTRLCGGTWQGAQENRELGLRDSGLGIRGVRVSAAFVPVAYGGDEALRLVESLLVNCDANAYRSGYKVTVGRA
jgi:hypothetical protein